jgi:hypothetical protein
MSTPADLPQKDDEQSNERNQSQKQSAAFQIKDHTSHMFSVRPWKASGQFVYYHQNTASKSSPTLVFRKEKMGPVPISFIGYEYRSESPRRK